MMRRGRNIASAAAWLLVLVVVMTTTVSVSAGLHVVGGSKANGWRTEYNYTEWSSKQRFYVGEWLYFGFGEAKRLYSILQVNATSYTNCNEQNPIKNVSRGAGRDVFNLSEPITYYFISGGGFCFHGMKLAVLTENLPPPPVQPPSPTKNGSASSFSANNIVAVTFGLLALVTSRVLNFL